jgi:hypothetical protein
MHITKYKGKHLFSYKIHLWCQQLTKDNRHSFLKKATNIQISIPHVHTEVQQYNNYIVYKYGANIAIVQVLDDSTNKISCTAELLDALDERLTE